jgi:hypothetical protein
MRERKLRQLDRTVTRLEKLVESIPKTKSKKETETLDFLKDRIESVSSSLYRTVRKSSERLKLYPSS